MIFNLTRKITSFRNLSSLRGRGLQTIITFFDLSKPPGYQGNLAVKSIIFQTAYPYPRLLCRLATGLPMQSHVVAVNQLVFYHITENGGDAA